MRKIYCFCFCLLTVVACSKNDPLIQPTNIEAKTILNVPYGNDPLQQMDIYLPANRNIDSTKVLVLIHGGGWYTGDKSASNPFVDSFKRRLPYYAIFNINYRLSNGFINLFPTQEQDVKAAIQFIYSQKNNYLISNKIVLAGESAGGHLAMLQAFKNTSPVKIKAVVSFFGPSDLYDMYVNPANGNTTLSSALAQVIGNTPTVDPVIYTTSSPASYISGAVPTISFHGSNDPLVKPSQSENIFQSLTANNIPASFTLYPGLGHGDDWSPTIFTDAFNKVQLFLNNHVQ